MAEQYIFTIEQLHKFYNKREVLKNIWLAFYPGAKIGVIGGNGSGKSTLLRIMAGVDKDFMGTARLTSGFSVGYVPQEPRLDETKDVRGNVEEAVAETRALLNKQEEISNKLGDCMPEEMEKLLDTLGKIQEKIEAVGGWDLDRHIDIAMDAMRPAARRRSRRPALRRREAPRRGCARSCSRSPTSCSSTSRRTISTPSRLPGSNGTCSSTRGRSCR